MRMLVKAVIKIRTKMEVKMVKVKVKEVALMELKMVKMVI